MPRPQRTARCCCLRGCHLQCPVLEQEHRRRCQRPDACRGVVHQRVWRQTPPLYRRRARYWWLSPLCLAPLHLLPPMQCYLPRGQTIRRHHSTPRRDAASQASMPTTILAPGAWRAPHTPPPGARTRRPALGLTRSRIAAVRGQGGRQRATVGQHTTHAPTIATPLPVTVATGDKVLARTMHTRGGDSDDADSPQCARERRCRGGGNGRIPTAFARVHATR